MKTLKDIKTSTGKKSTRLKPLDLNLRLFKPRRSTSNQSNVETCKHLYRKPPIKLEKPDWEKVITHRIYQIKVEIKELKAFSKEKINGSKKYLEYLEKKLIDLEKIKAELTS